MPLSNEKDWKEKEYSMLSFILNGKNRIRIYLNLLEEPCYAYEIARKENLTVSAVLRTFKDLDKAQVIVCLNPKDRYKKIYSLTEKALLLQDTIKNKNIVSKIYDTMS